MGHVTRAVIKLSNDISFAMPLMQSVIDGCGYNPEVPVVAFRYKNSGVIVEANRIIINNVNDEATAQTVIAFLRDIVNTADEKTTKVEVY